jgi:acid stress-induced BolA-like protein IbaG/YrbA
MLTANNRRNCIMNGPTCDHAEVQGDDGQYFEAVTKQRRRNQK